jgi:hypothetical protein
VQDDIVGRLRHIWMEPTDDAIQEVVESAADLIEAQQAEIERLRTALELAAHHMSMTGAPQTTIDAIRKAVRGG